MAEHEASCQCGALTVVCHDDPDFQVLCNCKACQKRTGSPFGVGAYIRRDRVSISGTSSSWGRTADAGRQLVNHFCPTCGSTVFWTLEMRPDHVGIAVGMFKGELPAPARAIWAEEAHDWMIFPEDMPVFQKATPET